MTVDRDALYQLLPAMDRERDASGALRQFMEVLTDQVAVLQDNLDQLYDDLFAETAADWALPYIAELIGLRALPPADRRGMTARAEVANTIGYRRRKGTAATLEQIAFDVTKWPARAVEYFELLVGTQHVDHVRPANHATPGVRDADALAFAHSPFERSALARTRPPRVDAAGRPYGDLTHVIDVRRIGQRRGRYNITNIGLFVWRLGAYSLRGTPAQPREPGDQHRFFVSPLGIDTQLFTLPAREDEISHLAEPINVPLPISRRMFASGDGRAHHYGPGLSLYVHGFDVLADVRVCDLSDTVDGGGVATWHHTPVAPGTLAIDPVLGRIALGDAQAAPPRVTYHYGFSADMGGGEYSRVRSFGDLANVERVSDQDPQQHQSVTAALGALGGKSGVAEVTDSSAYSDNVVVSANALVREVRAADGCRPTITPAQPPPAVPELVIEGDIDGIVTLNGLLIAGQRVRVRDVGHVRLRHCTIVPSGVSLVVESAATRVEIDSCILGGIRSHPEAEVVIRDSIVDAGERGVAYASDPDAATSGPPLTIERSTVFGKVDAHVVHLASNCIFVARVDPADDVARWPAPFLVERRQEGCIRFSYLPARSRTPRRFQCRPGEDADADRLRPVFTSERYGDPGYGQLDRRTAEAIRRGADDESEMGAFHHLYQPQREAYLQLRLEEYLRFGLEAGIFFAS